MVGISYLCNRYFPLSEYRFRRIDFTIYISYYFNQIKALLTRFFSGMNFALLLKEIEHILSLFLKEKQKNA